MSSASDQPKPKPSRRKRILRWVRWTFLVLLILVGALILFLPQIATGVLARLTTNLDLEQFDVQVDEVSWNTATLTHLVAADPGWQASAESIFVRYSPWDLLRGKVQTLSLKNLAIEISQEPTPLQTPTNSSPGTDTPTVEAGTPSDQKSFAWLHSLPEVLTTCPQMEAPNTHLTIKQGTQHHHETFDLSLATDAHGSPHLVLKKSDHLAIADLKPTASGSSLTVELTLPDPRAWLSTVESLLGTEQALLPAEFTPGPFEGEATITISDAIDTIKFTGSMTDLRYTQRNASLDLLSATTSVEGLIQAEGTSQLDLRGDLIAGTLHAAALPGEALTLTPNSGTSWTSSITWNDGPSTTTGTLRNLSLHGGTDQKPLRLTAPTISFSNRDGLFRTGGQLALNDLPLPVEFILNTPSPDNSPNAKLVLGPSVLDKQQPLLITLLPSGHAPDLTGTFHSTLAFRLAPDEPFSGVLELIATDAALTTDDGFATIGPLSGKGRLHLPADNTTPTLEFSGTLQSLTLDTRESIGFPLAHITATPATINISGNLAPENPRFLAKIEGLNLAGNSVSQPVAFNSSSLDLDWHGPILTAKASTLFGTTPLSFTYKHDRKTLPNDHWQLQAKLTLAPATIDEPLTNLGAFSDSLDGSSVDGTITSQFDFNLGSKSKLNGSLQFGITDGTIRVDANSTAITQLAATANLDLSGSDDTPSSWKINGTVGGLEIDTTDSLGFALTHDGEFLESPAAFSASGTTGMKATVQAEISHLTLSGEQNNEFLQFEESSLQFKLGDTVFSTEGQTTFGGNVIPFTYRQVAGQNEQGEAITSRDLRIPTTKLDNPLSNLGAFSPAVTGISFSGTVGAHLSLRSGRDKVETGSLDVSIANGTLILPDDGPVLKGITGRFLSPDLETLHTAKPESFSLSSLTYGDLSFTKLNGRYRIRPGGGLEIPQFQSNFLGGRLSIDPFTYPDDDNADFRMDLRFTRIDLRTLTKLFPTFDGRLEGSIDAHLPIIRKDGSYLPERGNIKLSKSSKARLRYNADELFTGGLDPKGGEYKRMKLAEDSLRDLIIPTLTGRLFDPREKGKAAVIRIEGQSSTIKDAPPIHLNFNFFEPDGEFRELLDSFFKNRDNLDFGL